MGSGTKNGELQARQAAANPHLDARAMDGSPRRAALRDRLVQVPTPVRPTARADFACFHACMDCGRLSREAPGECPACGSHSVVDLTSDDAAAVSRELDRERLKPKQRLRGLRPFLLALGVVVPVVGGSTAILVLNELDWTRPSLRSPDLVYQAPDPASLFLVLAGLAVLSLAVGVLAARVVQALRRRRRIAAARWVGPVRPGARLGRLPHRDAGEVAALAGPVPSPLTGTPCAAYRIQVVLEPPSGSGATRIMLDEHGAVDLRVGTTVVRGDSVLAELPLREVPRDELDRQGPSLARFLRTRGLDTSDGDPTFREACLRPGDAVRLETSLDRKVSLLSLPGSVRGNKGVGPYR